LLVNNSFVPGSFVALPLATFDLASGTSGSKGPFHHAHIDLVLGPGTPNVTVSLTNGVTGAVVCRAARVLSGLLLGSNAFVDRGVVQGSDIGGSRTTHFPGECAAPP
jgi:hypothetical protein